MKRLMWMVLAVSFAAQLAAPASAFAWWEYVDTLSGPTLSGPHFEARILCFMKARSDKDQAILKAYLIPVGISFPCVYKIPDKANYQRRFSIDLGVRWHWDDQFPPANRRRVNFVAVTPVFTWYVPLPANWDVLDVSAGMGTYWFISNAFTGHRGRHYDVRADWHLPTSVRGTSRWWVLYPTWRFGLLKFADRFEKDAFADVDNRFTSKAMDAGETVRYFGFFFDLDALLKK